MEYKTVHGSRVPIVPYAGKFTRNLLVRLCEAQNWRCCYCAIPIEIHTHERADARATIEHVIPRSAGGKDNWENLAAACALCNHGRRSMRHEKYYRFVQWKGRRKAAKYSQRVAHKIAVRNHLARQRLLRTLANDDHSAPELSPEPS